MNLPVSAVKTGAADVAANRLLVVDDSRLQRRILLSALSECDYELMEAASAEEALEICRSAPPRIVISDWMMPGMSGIDFCRILREEQTEDYIYVIILTSKSEKEDLAAALREGADDFLSKPLSGEELRGRIAAGERLLRMSGELREKNRQITAALEKVRDLNAALDRDLAEARKLQMSLVPRHMVEVGDWRINFILQPSGHVGGDMIGTFEAGSKLGIYALDVSGHGIASALITARLSSWLSGSSPDQNIALTRDGSEVRMLPPDEICRRLNQRFIGDIGTDHYFTILLGELDFETGRFSYCQAGHPNPLHQDPDGRTRFVGGGGMPIGLLDTPELDLDEIVLEPDNRLLIYSDGITECPSEGGDMLDEDGLARLVRIRREMRGSALLSAISWELSSAVEDGELPDDMSAILIERAAAVAPHACRTDAGARTPAAVGATAARGGSGDDG